MGQAIPISLGKIGPYHERKCPSTGTPMDAIVIGAACSEAFSGEMLANVLKPGLEYEKVVLESLSKNTTAKPLSIHTSAGVPAALPTFIDALSNHLPWSIMVNQEQNQTNCDTRVGPEDDWCVSLQVEGTSAVYAAVDMLMQLQHTPKRGSKCEPDPNPNNNPSSGSIFTSQRSKVAVRNFAKQGRTATHQHLACQIID